MPSRFYTRRFLNRRHHHSTGFILAEVPKTTPDRDTDAWGIELTIGDCGRQISLDFPLWDKGDRLNSVEKANLLVDVLTRFRDALVEEVKVAEERELIRKAKKSKKDND